MRAWVLAALLLAAAAAAVAKPQPQVRAKAVDGTVLEVARANDLMLLASGITLGGLNETLGPNFEGTILAPTNNAFTTFREALDDVEKPTTPQLIGNVLNYHVIRGLALPSANLLDGMRIPTLHNDTLKVSNVNGEISFEDSYGRVANVVTADLKANGGKAVIHIIDSVLFPTGLLPSEPPPAPPPPMADLPSELPSPEDDPWAPDDSWGWGPAPAPMAGEWVMRSSSTENVASCLALVACLLAAALMI